MQEIDSSVTSPWIRFPLDSWKPLIEGTPSTLYRKKSLVFDQSEQPQHVFIVKSGRIRITSYQSDGSEKQLYIAEQGAMIGESFFVQYNPETAVSGVAIVDSHLYCIPSQSFETVLRGNWDLTVKVMQVVCRKNNILLNQVLELSFSQSIQRIAQLLLNLISQYGVRVKTSVRIGIRFTHQDVASMISTSRVTVSNFFNNLAVEGTIEKRDGYFVVHDEKRLQGLAAGRSRM